MIKKVYKILFIIICFNFSNFAMQNELDFKRARLAKALINDEYNIIERLDKIKNISDSSKDVIKEQLIKQSNYLFLSALPKKVHYRDLIGAPLVVLSANGKHILTVDDNFMAIYDLTKEDAKKLELPKYQLPTTLIALSADGSHIVSVSESIIRMFDLSTINESIRRMMDYFDLSGITQPELSIYEAFTVGANSISSLVLSANARYLLACTYYTTRIWDLSQDSDNYKDLGGGAIGIYKAALSADGKHALTVALPWDLRIWDLSEDTKTFRVLKGHKGKINSLALSADARYALTASKDKTVRLWDLCKNQVANIILEEGDTDMLVALSANGNYALTKSSLNKVKFWNLTNKDLYTFHVLEHTEEINSVALSADGRYALTGSKNCIRLWDLVILSNKMSIEEIVLVIKLQKLKLQEKAYDELLDIPELRQILKDSKYRKDIEEYFGISLKD